MMRGKSRWGRCLQCDATADLPRVISSISDESPSLIEGRTDEAEAVYGRADHRGCCGSRRQARRWPTRAAGLGISDATFYNWKARFDGMDVSEAKRLKSLEDENVRLKKLLAEQMLVRRRCASSCQKKGRAHCGQACADCADCVGLVCEREAVAHLQATMGLSERRACTIIGADRTTIRYRSRRPPELELRKKLRDLASQRRRFGYRRLFVLLRGERGSIGDQPDLPHITGRRADCAQAPGASPGCRNPGADPRRGGSQCPLVARFRARPVRLRAAIPRAQHR